ncbi:MAG: YceI family protein [Gammaproteobacteria bacterium]|nr:YceI family protein [Gammaproteobacteria bacterium]
MNVLERFGRLRVWLALLVVLALPAQTALAQWELDSDSASIDFISIKNGVVAEAHRFKAASGSIGTSGSVQVDIDLNSVETLIDIRNERMRELLFKTAQFPTATVNAQIDSDTLAAVAAGGTASVEVPVTLALHGVEKTLNVALMAIGNAERDIRVFTVRPVLVSASQFGLDDGITALQKIAGLNAISTVVPVTLNLVFTHTE